MHITPSVKYGYYHCHDYQDYDGAWSSAEWIEDSPHPDDPEPVACWYAKRMVYDELALVEFLTEEEANNFNALPENEAYTVLMERAKEENERFFA